jgi:ribosomal-protein-alanine N-acetyltransferase
VIRRAEVGDALRVSELEHRNLGSDAWPFGFVAQGVAGEVPTAHWFVADVDGELIGHAVVSVVAEIAELQRISVDVEQRRGGLATALLATVEALARDLGAERVLLEVREDNDGARAFYAAAGFEVLARRERYYADGTAAEVMAKDLSGSDQTAAAAPA